MNEYKKVTQEKGEPVEQVINEKWIYLVFSIKKTSSGRQLIDLSITRRISTDIFGGAFIIMKRLYIISLEK